MKTHPNTINIMEKYPIMREFWDYEKNTVDPTILGSGSRTEVNLKCSVGHRFVKCVSSFLTTPKCPECRLAKNSLVAIKPEITKWWDYEKNGDDRPERHSKAESTKAWWKCPKCGYSWRSEINSRMVGKDQCPCCDLGIAFMSGINDAATRCPEILLDWDFDNNSVHPEEIFLNYKKPIHWKCHLCGYQFAKTIKAHITFENNIYKLRNCKNCNGRAIISGENDFKTLYPDLASEYVPEMNTTPIEGLAPNSMKMITWKCRTCEQIFECAPVSRVGINRSGKGCPFCDHKRPIVGTNDFKTWCKHNEHNDLLLEWDYKRNKKKPEDYFFNTSKSVHWKCQEHPEHIWDASIADRILGRSKCPTCFKDKPRLKFSEAHPEMLKYWDYEKNEFGPDHYNEFSNESICWKCDKGHSFEQLIFRYSSKGFYCIICQNTQLVQEVNDLKTMYPEIAADWDYEKNKFPPEHYKINSNKKVWWLCPDGHPSYQRTIRERTFGRDKYCPICMNTGVVAGINDALSHYPKLKKIWDHKGNSGKGPGEISFKYQRKIDCTCTKGHHWNEYLSALINADFTCAYCEDRKPLLGFNTLIDLYPDLAADWDYDDPHNQFVAPDSVTTKKGVQYAWICRECGNTFLASIPERINNKKGCLYCTRVKVDPERTSLKALYPDLASEFSEKNDYNPSYIFPSHFRYVGWDCNQCGMTWYGRIRDRIAGLSTCPYCSGELAIPGKTSLKALFPLVASEFRARDGRDADVVTPRYAVKVYWDCCGCGLSWVSTVRDRIVDGAKCPYCSGNKAIPGRTSLKALYPDIAAELRFEDERDPDTVLPNYGSRVQWNCKACSQTWSSTVKERIQDGFRCPYCSGIRAIPGKNSLKALYPDIAAEFFTDDGRDPDTVFPHYGVWVHWNCKACSQIWSSSVKERIQDGVECPYCSGKRAIPGKTSLKALYPYITAEFSSENDFDPDTMLPNNNAWVKWNCKECRLTWRSTVSDRVTGVAQCPYCNGSKAIPGKTSLYAVFTELIGEWNFKANVLNADPDQLLPSSTQMVWWKCNKCNQSYQARIKDRVSTYIRKKVICSYCKGYRRQKHHIL